MAKPGKELLKKVSSVSGAVAALLSAANAAGAPSADPETNKRVQYAVDALKRASGADADQVRFHAGGQVDPQAQEILLAGHTSHSSHVSGSYVRGAGSSDYGGSTYTPSSTPTYTPSYAPSSSSYSSSSRYTTPTTTASSTPAPTRTVNITSRTGTRLSGSIIQKGSWGLQLLLKDSTRVQVPRRKLRAEDITTLELPESKANDAKDVPATVYLRLNDGTNYTGKVSTADGEKVTLTSDDKTTQTFQRDQMDPETFLTLQGLAPDVPPPLAPAASPTPVSAVQTPPPQATPVAIGQKVLIKLKSGSKLLVTLLSRSDDEISFRDKDGHEYRLRASRLSTESLVALGMPVSAPDASPSPAPKHKKQA